MERGERKYTMTLPMGTQVEIAVRTALVPAANALYEENKVGGYTLPDALAMLALTSINGEQVKEVNAATLLDPIEYLTLRLVVESLTRPNQQQIDAAVATIRLVEDAPVLEPVGSGDVTTQGYNPLPPEYGAVPVQGENVPQQPTPQPYYSPTSHAPATT